MNPKFRQSIVDRERGLCALCSRQGTEVHHHPNKGMGGDKSADTKERCVLLCRECHQRVTGRINCPTGEQAEYGRRIKEYLEAVNRGPNATTAI